MNSKISIIAILGSLFLFSACTKSIGRDTHFPGQITPEKPLLFTEPTLEVGQTEAPSGIITLDDALQAALMKHPSQAAAWYEIKAREAAAHQAGRLPNPNLSGEIEEFGGSGDYSGTGTMVSKVGINQEIPLGGQISKRVRAAEAQTEIARLERAAQTLTLRTEVQKRFFRVYILQERLKLAKEKLSLIKASSDAVAKRVASGEAPPLDEVKVTVELASSEIAVERTKHELDAAKYGLAASWSGDALRFSGVQADGSEITQLPAESELLSRLEFNPNYRILKQNLTQASAAIELARAEAWSGLEIGGGIQQFNETDDHAFFLELTIPFPLFDRNQGRIREARQSHNKASKELEAGLLALKTALIETARRLRSAQEAYVSMQNTVMPAAEKAFAAVQKAYQAGEQDYLELVEAQRSLIEIRRERLDLLAELYGLRADLDGFTAEVFRSDRTLVHKKDHEKKEL